MSRPRLFFPDEASRHGYRYARRMLRDGSRAFWRHTEPNPSPERLAQLEREHEEVIAPMLERVAEWAAMARPRDTHDDAASSEA